MLTRLGNVLYWLGCIVAGLIIAADGYDFYMEGADHYKGGYVFIAVIAFAVWFVGRACRYVLAGT
jgi:hypothetical protein